MADDLATATRFEADPGACPCPPSERPAWLAPLSDPRNEPILMAAFQMFVEKGFAGATMLDIATCAKVSKETIYDRFENKDGLFYALLAWAGRQTGVDPSGYGEAVVAADPVAALEQFAVATWVKMSRAEAIDITRVAFGEARRNREVAAEFQALVTAGSQDVLPRIVAALNAQGLARIDDFDEFYHAFVGLLKGCLHQAILLGAAEIQPEPEATAWAQRSVRRLLKAFA
jgi:TetR/AcrR family transcriptional regulator, mexJK operon transcriptional repressor